MAGTASANFLSCVRGYHVYKDAWNPTIGDKLDCLRDCANVKDRYAVSVIDPSTKATVGHLPKKISKVCSLFLRRGGTVTCEVTGGRSYSHDLPQGGLEIPCLLIFTGKEEDISRLTTLLKQRS